MDYWRNESSSTPSLQQSITPVLCFHLVPQSELIKKGKLMNKVLFIEDDKKMRLSLADILNYKGYQVKTAPDGLSGIEALKKNNFDAVLLDIKMPGLSGIDVLEKIRQLNPALPVIMVSGHGTIDLALKSTRLGAYDFLEKPVDAERLLITLNNAINSSKLLKEKQSINKELMKKYEFIGESLSTRKLFDAIDKVAPIKTKVLITGETGVGKELVAYAIHKNSPRADQKFVKVNCAAIPKDLLESELFGHKKGSFTGAFADQKGKFVEASEGTIFLDEIGELDNRAQAKLLQVLQDDEVFMVGDTTPQKIDVRVIAATNKDLQKEIQIGNFREDLFFRLNVAHIHIPPLRERKADIPLLVLHYTKYFCEEYNRKLVQFPGTTLELLEDYEWHGNVRELKNTIEKLIIFNENSTVYPGQLMDTLQMSDCYSGDKNTSKKLTDAKNEFEKKYLLKILKQNSWKMGKTAQILGIDRTNLYKKMQRHGIQKP